MKNKKMKSISIILCAIMLIATLSGCSKKSPANSDTKKVYKLVAYNNMPLDSVHTQSTIRMCKNAEKESNGRLQIEVKYNGALGSDRDAIESCMAGTIDIVSSGTGNYDNFYAPCKIFDLPYLFDSADQAEKVVNGTIGEKVFSKLNSIGLQYLATGNNGIRNVSSKKPINSVADVKGLKIRLPQIPTYISIWKQWGANPIPIDANELYTSLKTGVVTAQDNAPDHTVSTKVYEVQPYYSMIQYAWMGLTTTMNMKKYNSLPKDLQEILKKCAIEAGEWSFAQSKIADEQALKTMKDAGVTINLNPDQESFKANLNDVYSQFNKESWYDQNIIDEIKKVSK